MRLLRLFVVIVVTAFALISLMFLLMVRVTDPLLPRAMFGVLNTRALLSERRGLSAAGVSRLDAGDRGGRSVHLRGARVQEPAAQEHRLRRDLPTTSAFLLIFSVGRDDRGDAAVQADAVKQAAARRRTTARRATLRRRAGAAVRRARLQEGHRARHLPRGARQRRRGQLPLRRQARPLPRSAADRRSTRCARPTTPARGPARAAARGEAAPLHPRSSCSGCSTPGHETDSPPDPPRDRPIRRRRSTRSSSRRVRPRVDYLARHRRRDDRDATPADPRVAALRRQHPGADDHLRAASIRSPSGSGSSSSRTPADIEAAARHIADFSVAGIRAVAAGAPVDRPR